MLDGIGDTIRVSLTEAPVFEIPVAKSMLSNLEGKKPSKEVKEFNHSLPYSPYQFSRRKSLHLGKIGHGFVPVVVSDLSAIDQVKVTDFKLIDLHYQSELDKWKMGDLAPDFLFRTKSFNFELPGITQVIQPAQKIDFSTLNTKNLGLWSIEEYENAENKSKTVNFIEIDASNLVVCNKFQDDPTVVWVLSSTNTNPLLELRRWILELDYS